MSREGGTRGQPHCLHHRQPEREERRKRGASIDPHGFDAGKLIKGKKRHVLVDMQGMLLQGLVTSADVQDRDGGVALLSTLFGMFPFLRVRPDRRMIARATTSPTPIASPPESNAA